MKESNNCDNVIQCTLHVCTSCRPVGFPREPKNDRPGFLLHQELERLIDKRSLEKKISLRVTECLSLCPRPCGVALSAPGAWTYLFGDQDAKKTAEDIIECALIYVEEPAGYMPREKRPTQLKSSILGRVPPS